MKLKFVILIDKDQDYDNAKQITKLTVHQIAKFLVSEGTVKFRAGVIL